MMAKEEGYGRGCHGEIISVPQSAMAKWAKQADKIVVIDGCFLHCHGRILRGIFNEDQLAIFDALSYYGKYTDIMDIDAVPEAERKETAEVVLNHVLDALGNGMPAACKKENTEIPGCSASKEESVSCCGG